MSEEHFETYDSDGKPAGLVPRSRVHREGRWHRAVNVFLFRSDGRLLVQRRHASKDVWPGAWDLSVAEHLKPGETYPEAAVRGLKEELGIEGLSPEPVGGIVESRVEDETEGIRDYELQQSFKVVYDGPVSPDPEEVSEVCAFGLAELAEAFAQRPDDFTSWFRRSAELLDLFGRGRKAEAHDPA